MSKLQVILCSAVLVFILSDQSECAYLQNPPPSLVKCKAEDAKCIKDATKVMIPLFVDGMPEYGVEVLDPMKIKSINASQENIIFTLTDITVVGLRNCQATKVTRDIKKSKVYLTLHCPSVTLDGEYVLEGTVIVVKVKGQGKIHVNLKSAVFDVEIDIVEKNGDDGIRHWNIKSFTHPFYMKKKSEVIFEHLNDHNELLRQASIDLLRENGNEVIKEIGLPVIKTVINRVMKSINHFFKALSIDDLSLD